MTGEFGEIYRPGDKLDYIALAIASAVANVGTGGGPFGAVVALPDGRFFTGTNRVTVAPYFDPTAHAEVVAIRRAATMLRRFDLSDATLYTSCAPCPMCLGATMWARIRRVVFAATPADAADAGFDDAAFYREMVYAHGDLIGDIPLSSNDVRVGPWFEHDARPDARAPFRAWAELGRANRTDY